MISQDYHPRRERSRNKVLNSLKNEPKRFKDLEKDTKLSPAGLTQILKLLKNEKVLDLTLIDGKSYYKLTKKGMLSLDDIINLANDVNTIRLREGKHFRDYSHLWGSIISSKLPWGIESDLTLDKNLDELRLLGNSDVEDIEEFIFKKLCKNIKKKKLNKEETGQIVLGFSIDYSKLIESIKENSLAYIKNMSKEEGKLLEKINIYPDRMTKEDWNRWEKLRLETYKKINVLSGNEK